MLLNNPSVCHIFWTKLLYLSWSWLHFWFILGKLLQKITSHSSFRELPTSPGHRFFLNRIWVGSCQAADFLKSEELLWANFAAKTLRNTGEVPPHGFGGWRKRRQRNGGGKFSSPTNSPSSFFGVFWEKNGEGVWFRRNGWIVFFVFCFCWWGWIRNAAINRQQAHFFPLRGGLFCGWTFSMFVSQHHFHTCEGPAIDEDLPSNEPNEEDEKPQKW